MKYFETFDSKYKSSDESWKKYRYEDDTLNFYKSQSFHKVSMYDANDKILAYCNYSVFDGKVHITFIESIEKGRGFGSILFHYMIDKFGLENIPPMMLTDDGAKMRKRINKDFNFNEEEYQNSISKHLNPDIIEEIKKKHPIVADFLKDMINLGYEETWKKWKDFLLEEDLLNKYDFNDISDISTWIKGSKTNDHKIEDEPPFPIMEDLKKLL